MSSDPSPEAENRLNTLLAQLADSDDTPLVTDRFTDQVVATAQWQGRVRTILGALAAGSNGLVSMIGHALGGAPRR